jgi:uncharacterized integral membrane protein
MAAMSAPTKPPGAGSSEPHPPTPGTEPQPRRAPVSPHAAATTRAAAAWFATAAALVLLVLLVILMLQNQQRVEVRYLGFTGSLPLGTALLIAAVGGAAVVSIVGVVRLTQLRIGARRARRSAAKPDPTP